MPQLTIEQAVQLASQHHAAGRLAEAEQLYRRLLSLQPDNFDVQIRLGIALKDQAHFDEAIALFQSVIAARPDFAPVHSFLGVALQATGRVDEAIAAYRQAIALDPKYPDAHNNLGFALTRNGRLEEAIDACREAIALMPEYAEAHSNLGIALKGTRQLDEAISAYRQAIALRPDLWETYSNLGNALSDKGELDEAIAVFRQAVAMRPNLYQALGNLGNALKNTGRIDEAIAAYRQAMVVKPDYLVAHSNLLFALTLHPAYGPVAIAEEHRIWNRRHAQPLARLIEPHTNDPNPQRRLKVGYVSPDFCEHVVGFNLLPLFDLHDHQQFEIICYAQVAQPDAVTRQFQQDADQWRSIMGLSDEEVASQIRQDQIDILVDLALHTANNRLMVFARKPAPVQVTFAGYPGSTGLTAIDYRLSDPYLDPPGMDESIYSEKTIRLPDSFWCYDPLDCRDVPINPLPALSAVEGSRPDGPAEQNIVTFGCLNNFGKINDDALALWTQVLRQVDRSRLLLLAPEGSHRDRTRDRLAREGVEPARVEFLSPRPRRQYLELYQRIDVGLDSFPYNGHTTSLDSFWMGVPVVTLVGQTAVSRAGWCQLSNLGLTELAANTPEQFVRIAVGLARDLPRLKELRASLRSRMEQSPLMNAPRFARNIEAAYRQIWRLWCERSGTQKPS